MGVRVEESGGVRKSKGKNARGTTERKGRKTRRRRRRPAASAVMIRERVTS